MTVLLVHSPLLGPASWAEVAARLPQAVVPDLRPALVPPYYASLSAAACAGLGGAEDVTVIAHSRAGPLVPSITARLGEAVSVVVYVDARLPHPGRTWLSTVSPPQADHLRTLVEDGRLAPWNTWFAASDDWPDLGEIPRVPWDMLTEPAPHFALPPIRRRYIQLSSAYVETADRAAFEGFDVVRLDIGHLGMMTHPDLVTDLCLENSGHGE